MSLSIPHVLAQLEARVAHHREEQARFAEQEAFYRDKAAFHQTRLDEAQARLEAFRAAADAAGELLTSDRLAAPPPPRPEVEIHRKKALSRMMARVIEDLPPDATFGATSLTDAIEERWGAELRSQPDPRSVATTLRRWAAAGEIDQVREGRAYNEGLYRKIQEET